MSLAALFLSSCARSRRVPSKGWKVLTGKQKRDFNKGKRAMQTGLMDTHGNFRIVPSMLPVYRVPDLTNFKLKPYVAFSPEDFEHQRGSASSGSGSAAQQAGKK